MKYHSSSEVWYRLLVSANFVATVTAINSLPVSREEGKSILTQSNYIDDVLTRAEL